MTGPAAGSRSIPVLGLAGGIGAGKSAVAAILASLGCVVSDSDARARSLLDRPDIRARLVEWWGSGVLNSAGQTDRASVARLVFADPAQRRRLETLIHPILRAERATELATAIAAHARAFVIDAPLLFEAGLNAECDAVLFVEAPRTQRLERLGRTRGWDEAELIRREAAQWPLEKKRAASTFVVVNDADRERLAQSVAAVLDRLAFVSR